MAGFHRVEGTLRCDGVSLAEIAAVEGTPLYVYSAATIIERYRAIDEAFASYPHALHYALKANSTLALVRLLRGLGSGADANSGGEIDVALRAGFIPPQIVFTGVGKTTAELAYAIELGVKSINAESAGELERIDALARERQTTTRVALRINPDIDAQSHPHISTGLKTNKFGIAISEARELARRMREREGLEIVGLHCHVGSQILDLDPLRRAARALVDLARELKDDGIAIDHLDVGGGLGVSYDGRQAPSAREYADAVLPIIRESGLTLIMEPGRNIIAPAGALLSRVVDVKDRPDGKLFVILDAGMTELLRPMLYGAFHRIEAVEPSPEPAALCDVVGPLCETSDTLGTDRSLPRPRVGELIAVLDAGAYGAVMASNYNRRTLPAEVLVEDGSPRRSGDPATGSGSSRGASRDEAKAGRWSVIRRRQTIDDLLALEN